MEDFWFNVTYGIEHILDKNGYDHVLFLMALAIPYLFKDLKKVILLVSVFTLGHTVTLITASYGYITINGRLVEFFIPITILITALYNIYNAKKIKNKKQRFLFITALFFGFIHGLGFSREFKMLAGQTEDKFIWLLEFVLGIEIAQIIVVLVILLLGFFVIRLFRRSRQDWIVVGSSIVIGLVIPYILKSF